MQTGFSSNKFQATSSKKILMGKTSHGNLNSLKKEIVTHILKQSILHSGDSIFEIFERSLFEKYHCEISDCLEKPEYIGDVLLYVYDGTCTNFVEKLKNNLANFSDEKGIKEFIDELESFIKKSE